METGTVEPAPAADNLAARITVVRRVILRSQGYLRSRFVAGHGEEDTHTLTHRSPVRHPPHDFNAEADALYRDRYGGIRRDLSLFKES